MIIRLISRFLLLLLLVTLCAVSLPLSTEAASATAYFFVSPSSGSRDVGTTFDVDFKLNTGGQEVGAVGLTVSYSSNLEYVSASSSGTNFDFVATPPSSSNPFSMEQLSTSGYNGTSGQIHKITFRVKSAGTGTITMSNLQALANSDNSNITDTGRTVNGSYTLASPATATPTPAATSNAGGGTTSTATPKPTSTKTTASSIKTSASPKASTSATVSPTSSATSSASTTPSAEATNTPIPSLSSVPSTPSANVQGWGILAIPIVAFLVAIGLAITLYLQQKPEAKSNSIASSVFQGTATNQNSSKPPTSTPTNQPPSTPPLP